MTQWAHNSTGGRSHHPRSLLAAWLTVLVHPIRFFRREVTPGDQAPALFFLVGVVAVEESIRFALDPAAAPVWRGQATTSALLAVVLAATLIAPVALHFIAALQTLLLIPFVPDRGGISETVQVLAYATAPCVLAGVPFAPVRILCTVYGAALLVVGMAIVHNSRLRALPVALPVAAIEFGVAFRGFEAVRTVIDWLSELAPVLS